MTTKQAIEQLVEALKSDPGYRIGWQANIAVAFQDEWQRASKAGGLPCTPQHIHNISNAAADNFLNLLCRDVEATEDKVSGETPAISHKIATSSAKEEGK